MRSSRSSSTDPVTQASIIIQFIVRPLRVLPPQTSLDYKHWRVENQVKAGKIMGEGGTPS